jgi:multidrug efflux system membrane fusion protein
VTTALVSKKTVSVELSGSGSVEAASAVAVRSVVTGQIVKIHFRAGDRVRKGDALFTLDDRPFQLALQRSDEERASDAAAVRQAEAALARDRALVKTAEGEAARTAELFAQGLVPRSRLDAEKKAADALAAAVKGDETAVAGARAKLRAVEAAVQAARLQLSQTIICAPIGGRTGSLAVSEGSVVGPADASALVTLVQPSPVTVEFTVPEQEVAHVNEASAAGVARVTASPRDDEAHSVPGALTYVAPTVDRKAHGVRVKATFDNPQRRLWPGQTARVTLALGARPGTTVVPTRAVQSGLEGTFVYVVQKDLTVQPRPVKTGPTVEDLTVVEKGLEPGERVVTEGQRRLYPGARIETTHG